MTIDIENLFIAIASPLALVLLSLILKPVRTALFYKKAEYDLACERPDKDAPFACKWVINWEDYKLTIEAGDISDDKMERVIFKRRNGERAPERDYFPKDTFVPLFEREIFFHLDSIVRVTPISGPRVYTLRVVFRRRRLFRAPA